MNSISKLHNLGQSLWYDNIQRKLLKNGELAHMISDGVIRGVTSNPSIFQNAIANSNDYDGSIRTMAWAGLSSEEIFWQVAVEDIQAAADLFLPLYKESKGGDGYVSLEVNPLLANDTQGTIVQAKALWARVNRPNLMIKIPATREGIPAIREAIGAGLNVNVTLIFSLDRYLEVIDAYFTGLEDRVLAGKPIDSIASVASFFISRVDTKVDGKLSQLVSEGKLTEAEASKVMGKAAIANARITYQIFEKEFCSYRYQALKAKGAHQQRPLWASTSTKNKSYRDVIYVEELIGAHTVNTVPPQTLDAFADHGVAEKTIRNDQAGAHATLAVVEKLGISMRTVTDELEEEGVKAFATAFDGLLASIEQKRKFSASQLGMLQEPLKNRIELFERERAVERLYAIDPTLWTSDPAGQKEIRNREDWLNLPWTSEAQVPEILAFREEILKRGYTHVLLLGMGGSSLAPEVMSLIHASEAEKTPGLDLSILDSTDPVQVRAAYDRSPMEKTLYIVSSKSGTTSEIVAYLDYFWAKAQKELGSKAAEHFVAITDPGTALEKLAKERNFTHVFQADAKVGGRYSALTVFGLVPAALIGLDLHANLENAREMAVSSKPDRPISANPGAVVGGAMGEAWKQGKDKLTILTDPAWSSFGSWLEQLVAESSGKIGRGIVPVDVEPEIDPEKYSRDRLFVYLRTNGSRDAFAAGLNKAGHPLLQVDIHEVSDLGGQFFLWEIAIALACAVLQVNPFDQPDVQDSKTRTQAKIDAIKRGEATPQTAPEFAVDGVKIYADLKGVDLHGKSVREILLRFLDVNGRPSDYIAINAYLPRNAASTGQLQQLRKMILEKTGKATTLGFGPRFQHSTGQLHKGGSDEGMIVQIIANHHADIAIPEEGVNFGVMERAQADGDLEALLARKRRVIRIELPKPDAEHLLK